MSEEIFFQRYETSASPGMERAQMQNSRLKWKQ
jgi:hypothetical protein